MDSDKNVVANFKSIGSDNPPGDLTCQTGNYFDPAKGACVPYPTGTKTPTCTEDDGGQDIYTYGTVRGTDASGKTYGFADNCNTDKTSVYEAYCKPDGTWSYSWNKCPNICVDGACVKTGVISCDRFTDPNYDIYLKGLTSKIAADGTSTPLADACTDGGLVEFNCNKATGVVIQNPPITCPNGCENGMCLKTACANGGTMCNEACVDTKTDDDNCGGCGSEYACGWFKYCNQGSCSWGF